jgi:ubiquitin carboxyl-terminal hydrolase 36/42
VQGAGLRNMGNTCFLNATLQCITHTVPLFKKLRCTDHSTPCSCMDYFWYLLFVVLKCPRSFFCFALNDLFYWYHIDDEDGFCSFCALKGHMEESVRRSGSVLVPARFKDNLSSILCIWDLCPVYLILSQIHGVSIHNHFPDLAPWNIYVVH